MLKKICLGSAAISLALIAGCGEKPPAPKKDVKVVKVDPASIERTETKNAYFGDLHVHTKNSFDAFITGTRTTADDAYRFAKGATIDNGAGSDITISGPPLDFYGVTDHGEYMGVVAAMRDKNNPISKSDTAKSIFGLFGGGRDERMQAFMKVGTTIVTGEPLEDIYDRDFIDSAWAENVAAAEKHNEPGVFTTFAAYEYTNMNIIGDIDDNFGATNLHRNVVFKDKAPTRLFSTLDSTNPEDLWEWMNGQRANGVDVISIPHNSNASNGQMFAMTTTDGSPLTKAYAENRLKNEPIVEMTQVKGTSETHPLLSPEDEFADHELYEILVGMPVAAQKVPGSFVRQSLARGIGLEAELGANPYAFGFIGSTDAHVSSSSLSEENFFGKFSHDLDMANRRSIPPKGAKTWENAKAEEGDLDIISTTSGPRLKTRFFAGNYADDILSSSDMLEQAYANGSPMGGNVEGAETSPDFIAWAIKDPEGYPLQRIQVVKVWSEGGANMERIYDVACAGGATPDAATRRCPDNGATVDLTTCKTNDETGAGELKALWNDPDYQAGQKTAYYLRVLENPKCRWSTWDAVRNGTPPNPDMQATLQDRAWSSAIWVQ